VANGYSDIRYFCPAGPAHYAWGGHSMAFFLLLAQRLVVALPLVGKEQPTLSGQV
jgi:hypothetical protein